MQHTFLSGHSMCNIDMHQRTPGQDRRLSKTAILDKIYKSSMVNFYHAVCSQKRGV